MHFSFIGNCNRCDFKKFLQSYFAMVSQPFLFTLNEYEHGFGLIPIVGSPLPILSYGGSSMLATMIGFGIVMSAKVHSQQSIA